MGFAFFVSMVDGIGRSLPGKLVLWALCALTALQLVLIASRATRQLPLPFARPSLAGAITWLQGHSAGTSAAMTAFIVCGVVTCLMLGVKALNALRVDTALLTYAALPSLLMVAMRAAGIHCSLWNLPEIGFAVVASAVLFAGGLLVGQPAGALRGLGALLCALPSALALAGLRSLATTPAHQEVVTQEPALRWWVILLTASALAAFVAALRLQTRAAGYGGALGGLSRSSYGLLAVGVVGPLLAAAVYLGWWLPHAQEDARMLEQVYRRAVSAELRLYSPGWARRGPRGRGARARGSQAPSTAKRHARRSADVGGIQAAMGAPPTTREPSRRRRSRHRTRSHALAKGRGAGSRLNFTARQDPDPLAGLEDL